MDFLGNDSDSEVEFTINEGYAKRYEKWRRGEEIQKLKDKYGNVDESDSSTSEEEDEDGKELTQDVEKQFFKTLSCLKQKNPKIYDQNVRFFEKKEPEQHQEKRNKGEPALTLAGYQRKVLMETEGQFDDREETEEPPFEMMSSQDQENDIKQSFKEILQDSDNEDEEQWGSLFTRRVKTAEELKKEEEDYKQWLAGEDKKLKDEKVKDELKGLHDYWADPKLDEKEKFLRDYILNKRYLDHDNKKGIPSYDEIVHDSDSNLSADEDTIAQQDEFERKYNFRFEEPDREFIKRYPRTLEQSMRKKDDKRKKHREEVKQRKQAERSKKDEELKRLKKLKKKEILEKIKKLQHITGNEDIAFQTEDLEGDFNPEEHDKRMAQIFNEDYYGGLDEEEKPEFPDYDEELEIENWDNWQKSDQYNGEELHCEDPGFNMDCDYDPTKKKELQQELLENSRRRKKRKKSKFQEALEKDKPPFDPKDKSYEQYIEEYYALDYEDLIGDIPCRFKYRKVVPNDYGLDIEEILNASDQELNRWVSIKKITRRLPEHIELYDVKAYKRKASNFNRKAKCFPSLYGPKMDDQEEQVPNAGKNRKFDEKGKENSEFSNEDLFDTITGTETNTEFVKPEKKSKKKKNKHNSGNLSEDGVGNVKELNNYLPNNEENNKKMKNWIVENFEASEPSEKRSQEVINVDNENESSGRKKKRKKESGVETSVVSIENGNNSRLEKDSVNKSKKRKHSLTEEISQQKRIKKKKLKNNRPEKDNNVCEISDERLRSYGLNPKKYKNKLKYKNKNK